MSASATQTSIRVKSDQEEEQLLELFWNRAQLKKDFAKLKLERDRLMDRVRQQEGATLRAQQQLEQLEGLLVDPHHAANAAVFYQLRGIWQHCRKKLTRFARDLSARQRDREHQQEIHQFVQTRQAEYDVIDQQISRLGSVSAKQEAELRECAEERQRLSAFWRFFKRRSLNARFASLGASYESTVSRIERLQATKRELGKQPQPVFDSLSIEGKRLINLAIIALAQQLLLHFSKHDVANMAREASVRSVSDVDYGGIHQCRELNKAIDKTLKRLDMAEDLPGKVHQRAEYLRRDTRYRRESDTVPEAGSFARTQVDLKDTGQHGAGYIDKNVLAEEYWDIYTVLLT